MRPAKGMRVRCIKEYQGRHESVGQLGVILNISKVGIYCVQYDRYVNGHDNGGYGEFGRCWEYHSIDFEKYHQIVEEV